MTNIPNVIRWNANFVRGLAQSVLERARVIRGTLAPFVKEEKLVKPRKAAKRVRKARRRNG